MGNGSEQTGRAVSASASSYPFRHEFDAARYPTAYLRLGVREDAVQAAALAALRGRGALVFPVDSGAKLLRGRAVGALRRAGVARTDAVLYGATGAGFHGLADLVGILPGGRALFVEVKAPAWIAPSLVTGRMVQKRAAGAPSEAQLAFLARAARQGAVVGVVWSGQDVGELLAAAEVRA